MTDPSTSSPSPPEDGRELVECDAFCGAFVEPETRQELKDAYEHWKSHNLDGGCSHGC